MSEPTNSDVLVHEVHYKDNHFKLDLEHPVFAHVVSQMVELFDKQHGVNYLEMQMAHPTRGLFVCTIQRKDGKTPAQVIDELKLKVAELEKQLGK